MRFAVAALCVLALTGPTWASDDAIVDHVCNELKKVPKAYRDEPAVKWQVSHVSLRLLNSRYCPTEGLRVLACTYPSPKDPATWLVVIASDADISFDAYACIIQYEKAHMPPFFWVDPKMEGEGRTAWSAQQKADYAKGQTVP